MPAKSEQEKPSASPFQHSKSRDSPSRLNKVDQSMHPIVLEPRVPLDPTLHCQNCRNSYTHKVSPGLAAAAHGPRRTRKGTHSRQTASRGRSGSLGNCESGSEASVSKEMVGSDAGERAALVVVVDGVSEARRVDDRQRDPHSFLFELCRPSARVPSGQLLTSS